MENYEFSIPQFLVNMEEPVKQNMQPTLADNPPSKSLNGIKMESQEKCFGFDCRRILVLIYISLMGIFCLICYDLPGSLETEIEKTFRVQPYQFEYLYSIYCIPNIVLAFCSGILIDRVFGVKLSALIVALITLVGQIIFTVGGFVKIYWILLVARFIYGVGGDSIMVVISYYTVLWFEEDGLNFVFGMCMSMSRLGTSFVFLASTYSYSWMKGISDDLAIRIGSSFSISIISGLLILICVLALGWETERSGKLNAVKSKKLEFKEENNKFNLREILVYPIKYWLLSVVYVSVQTAVLVFVTCSQELLMSKYEISLSSANHLGSVFNLVVALSSPLAGILVDRIGFNLLIINLASLIAALSLFWMAFINSSPYIPLILLAISCGVLFSTVLPLTSKIVPASQLGAAFGMTIGLSDLSLAVLNIVAGYLLGQFGSTATLLFYASLFLVGLLCGLLLWICDRLDGGTLQQ